jgi:hypothetical protein
MRLIPVLFILFGCAAAEGTLDLRSHDNGNGSDNDADSETVDATRGSDDGDDDCDCEDDQDSGRHEWTVRVGVNYWDCYEKLALMTESPIESHWIDRDRGIYDPAGTSYDANYVEGNIDYPGYGDLKIQVEMDRGDEYAYYNHESDYCDDQTMFVSLNGQSVPVQPLSWSGRSNPRDGEGCDGYIDERYVLEVLNLD